MSGATSVKNEIEEQPPNKKDLNGKEIITEAIGICSISGEKFKVPETYDCLETLFTPKKWVEIPVLIQIGFIIFYIFLLAFTNTPRWVCHYHTNDEAIVLFVSRVLTIWS